MRILLVSATALEVAPLTARFATAGHAAANIKTYTHLGHHIDVLTTGVGMVPTAFWCARTLAPQTYGLALNLGICGSFDDTLIPGQSVHVTSDTFSELGAQDGESFLDIHALNLLDKNAPPFTNGRLVNQTPPSIPALKNLPAVTGITVNTVHGRQSSISQTTARLNPQIESMEGAAFMYACLLCSQPFAQVRTVSNKVERRNRPAWKIPQALAGLCETTLAILADLPQPK